MNFDKILSIIETATNAGPAFFELAELAIATFGEDDQAKLQLSLAAARNRTDELHGEVQDVLSEAAHR
ncbi:MAG TPA: hypothetical protein VN152_09155 [Sphingopyxis sp.]|nr:hypothetical protein [Sphingopyxis sp.]